MNGTIIIKKEWLEKNQKKFLDAYNEQDYVEKKDYNTELLIEFDNENNENFISDDDRIRISSGNDDLYISFETKPTITELLNLATIISKYYNKAKSAIEALK